MVQYRRMGTDDTEVPIMELQPGERFRADNFEGGWTYGTLIYCNQSRARVLLAGKQVQVVFEEVDGKTRYRSFEALGKAEVNWPRERPVQRVAHDNEDPDERTSRMASAEDEKISQATGLQTRFDFQLRKLQEATTTNDTGKMEVLRARIAALEEEAKSKGFTLKSTPTPVKKAPAPVKKVVAPKGTFSKDAEEKSLAKASGKPAPERKKAAPTTGKAKVSHDCLCGCEQETMSLYKPGHDARVKGLLLNVERGLIKRENIPATLLPFVKFKPHGKQWTLTHAPVKIPKRDDVENTSLLALEAMDI